MVFASFVLVAAVLYFAKSVFIPIAVATLFTFLLSPVVIRLQRWRFPKPLAIVTTVTLAFTVVALISWLIMSQFVALAAELPKYEQNLHAKARMLKAPDDNPVFTRALGVFKGLQKDFEQTDESASMEEAPGEEKPVPVEVQAPKPSIWQTLRRAVGPVLGPAATGGMVVILVLAMLFKREDLRDRFIKVVSGGQLNVGTEALDDAARRISRYLGMLLVVNVTYGIPIGIGLYFIGVPSAVLWGVLAVLLRFIPYVGPWIAAAFPIALAFAVDPGFAKVLLTIGLFVTVELISNNLVEPWVYGSSTGVSPLAVIAGAIFWTWLWGGVWLFLATPLTVCIVVMGKYVPGLRFIHDMFGSDAVLQPHARLYQRMLAMDYEEILRMAEEYVEDNDMLTFYDQVMIPALIQAEEDRATGTLAEVRQHFILQSSRDLIEDLADRAKNASGQGQPFTVLCLPARDDVDEIVALMLAQLLGEEGRRVRLVPATVTATERNQMLCASDAEWILISAVPPDALPAARRLCRQLKHTCPSKSVMVGLWTPNAATTQLSQRLARAQPDRVVTTLRDALQQFAGGRPVPEQASVTPAPEKRQSASDAEFLDDTDVADLFDAVAREVARTFDVPISLVSVVDIDPEFWRTHIPLPRDIAEAAEPLRLSSLAAQAAAATEPFAVGDTAEDKRCSDDSFLVARGIRAYAVAPLRTHAGQCVGLLCVLDTQPHRITSDDLRKLHGIAARLMETAEAHAPLRAA